MEIKIVKIHNAGNAASEYVELEVNQNTNVNKFILLDTTYDSSGVSNIDRHPYTFPNLNVDSGDVIYLYTKKGLDITFGAVKKLYWNSNHAIWNDDRDKAFLYKIADSQIFAVSKYPYSNLLQSLYHSEGKPKYSLSELLKKTQDND